MTAELPNSRYERKFVVQSRSLADILAAVRCHPAIFREAYPPRAVNNIYLDSPSLRAYFDHVNGTANRVKHRIRWYGPLNGTVANPVLERKLKRGQVGGKQAFPLAPIHINGCLPRQDIAAALAEAELADAQRLQLRLLRPSLVDRYQRHYFKSANGLFRLTVDSQIQFFRAGQTGAWANPVRPRDVAVIIELKFEPRHADQLSAVTNTLPFRMTRCSKYVKGLEIIGIT